MNIGFKIMAFMICLNIASGIMSALLPTGEYNLPTSIDITGEEQADLNVLGNLTIDPSGGSGSNPETFGDRVLDFVHLGWITRITDFIQQYLLGFTPFMIKTFGVFGQDYSPYVAATNIGISFAYVLALVLLWTGKRLNK